MTLEYSFDYISGHLTIAPGSTEIPSETFNNIEAITSVSIPDSVTSISESAFEFTGLSEGCVLNQSE